MESLLSFYFLNTSNSNYTKTHKSISSSLVDYMDFPKLDNKVLKECCDVSKMSLQCIIDVIPHEDRDNVMIEIVDKIFTNKVVKSLSLKTFNTLKLDTLSEKIKRLILNKFLINEASTELICAVLDKLETPNYGDDEQYMEEYNPLIYCSRHGLFELVKLLVEKYNADINYKSRHGTTAIMYTAQLDNSEITKYLFDKNADLETDKHIIDDFATKRISSMLNQLIIERHNNISKLGNKNINNIAEKKTQVPEDTSLYKETLSSCKEASSLSCNESTDNNVRPNSNNIELDYEKLFSDYEKVFRELEVIKESYKNLLKSFGKNKED